MSAACPSRMASRCVAFSWAAQLLWSVTASNCQWSTVHDVDPSHFGFTMMLLVLAVSPPSHLVRASIATSCISNCWHADMWLQFKLSHVTPTSSRVTCSSTLTLQTLWSCYWTTTMIPFNYLSTMYVYFTVSSNSLWAVCMSLISLINSFWQAASCPGRCLCPF